jgi:hypothetical protein
VSRKIRSLNITSIAAFLLFTACSPSANRRSTDAGFDASDDATTPGSLAACFAGIGPTREDSSMIVLSFTADGGDAVLRYALEPGDDPAIGETTPWELMRFGIERAGETECITAAASLEYTVAHHNWDDTAAAEGEHSYAVHQLLDIENSSYVFTLATDGAAPAPLTFTSCEQIPPLSETSANYCHGYGAD